ncbi:MAG: metallophosphoesterase, partial [Clostridia bacterium]|nr:metallophosphoesterase [Clostridia bacterium]
MKSSVLKSRTLMIISIIFIAIALLCGIAATGAVANAENAETTIVTNVAHLSDLHIYPVNYSNPYSSGKVSALGSTKLMVQSEAVLETALKEVYDMGDNAPTVMLISGDLTSNGEYAGHVYLAETLKQFTAKMRNRTDTTKDFSSFQI